MTETNRLKRLLQRFVLLAAATLVGLPSAHAQDEIPGTVISLGGMYDEAGSFSLSAGLDQALGTATWLQLTAGMTDTSEDFVDLSTRRVSLGIEHFFAPAGIALDVEYWGDRELVETVTLAGELYFRVDAARFGLNAAWREVDLSYEVPLAARNLVDDSQSTRATGFGANFRYSWQTVSLYGRGLVWDYEESIGDVAATVDLSRVPVLLRPAIVQRLSGVVAATRFLSTSSLTLANSLLARAATIGLDYRFGERTVNVEIGHDRGEVDDLDVTSFSTGLLFSVGGAADMEIRLGLTDAEEFGSSVFGGLSLFFYL